MLSHIVIGAFKSLWNRKFHSLISVISLCIGLTVFGLMATYVKKETSYNDWPDSAEVYRVVIDQHGLMNSAPGTVVITPPNTLPDLQSYFGNAIAQSTRMVNANVALADAKDTDRRTSMAFVDPQFAEIFQLEVVAGNLATTLAAPGMMAVDEKTAASVFGNDAANSIVGKTYLLTSNNKLQVQFEVGAIYRVPTNAAGGLNIPMLAAISDATAAMSGPRYFNMATPPPPLTQATASMRIWIKLAPTAKADEFNAGFGAFLQKHGDAFKSRLLPDQDLNKLVQYRLQSLQDVYFNPVSNETGGDFARVMAFSVVGLLVLLVGCSNTISLGLAAALERRREIGIRKAAGAQRNDILQQHYAESVLLAMLALLPAIGLVELLLPKLAGLLNIVDGLALTRLDLLLLVVIAVVVGLVCGAYPALVLASYQPQAMLKAGAGTGTRNAATLRTLLVAVQFTFAQILLIGTLGLYAQIAVMQQQPLGFRPDNLMLFTIYFESNTDASYAIQDELMKVPGVTAVTPLAFAPFASGANQAMSLWQLDAADTDVIPMVRQFAYTGFFPVAEIPLMAGRHPEALARLYAGAPATQPSASLANARPAPVQKVLINERASVALGFATPAEAVGKTLYLKAQDPANPPIAYESVGVVGDSRFNSLRTRPAAEVYTPLAGGGAIIMLRYETGSLDRVKTAVDKINRDATGRPPISQLFVDDMLATAFDKESREAGLLLGCAALALFLSCIGLYGLAAFSMGRQIKEVGVRKALGANAGSIAALFILRFARPIVLSNIVAWPVALYFVLQWMQRFPYQLEKAWLLPLCLAASSLVLTIALVTIGYMTLKSASARPVLALRYE